MCEASSGEVPWSPRGPSAAGLRFWDATYLCGRCADALPLETVTGEMGDDHHGALKVIAASATNPDLVHLVGQFKYHGVRGLAWPLARLLESPLQKARRDFGEVDSLVPVALHSSRRRARGFNQAEILARLAIHGTDLDLETKALVRGRKTRQQAKIGGVLERKGNLTECFRAHAPSGSWSGKRDRGIRVGLIDDLITSGWTCVSAAAKLREAGWDVKWALGLGLAAHPKKDGTRVDTWEAGF